MTAPLQYLLDGVDVANYARTLLTNGTDLPMVGDDNAVPFAPGAKFRRRTPGPGELQIGLLINGTNDAGDPETVAQWQQNWADFKAFVWRPETARTLTRRLLTPSGVVESSALVTLNQLPQETMQSDRTCTTVLDLRVLDGYLYDTAAVTVTAPGTDTIAGEARTNRLIITMGAGTLTNTTTGAILTYSGAGTVTIDVANWTATSGGSSVIGDLSWPAAGHDCWFDLDPGANVLTGTASIEYNAARLP